MLQEPLQLTRSQRAYRRWKDRSTPDEQRATFRRYQANKSPEQRHQEAHRNYLLRRELQISRARAFRERRRAYLNDRKSVPCADCGGTFPPYAMDFDHRDKDAKVRDVGAMAQGSLQALEAEIAKCDVICANCHRIRTHNRGYHRYSNIHYGRLLQTEAPLPFTH